MVKTGSKYVYACRVCVNHISGDAESTFKLIYRGNCEFSNLSHSARRLYAALLQKVAFNYIYQNKQQSNMYNKLGRRHFIDKQYKLASKMFYLAISLNPSNKNYKINIREAMQLGNMKDYLGIKMNLNLLFHFIV